MHVSLVSLARVIRKTSNGSVLRRTSANMLRVQWFRLPLSVLCLLEASFCIGFVVGDCWYNNEMHTDGMEVPISEPCLNCTCSRGALLCYLRVCPQLPNPPPPGCILLYKYHTCCPELICTDLYKSGNSVEARAEPDDGVIDERTTDNACIINGTIYAPGSAMDSSSLCEYCYCLGGRQICIKPKCLLPVGHCKPIYNPSSCCPVHYDCSQPSSTTTTQKSEDFKNGCFVDGTYYREGGKVLGVGHSPCDNCYCLRGILRCEPLSCDPPLFGCTPVVRTGECCASSYNCSVFKVEPIAKLHKEMFDMENTNLELARTTKVQRNSDFGTTTKKVSSTTIVPESEKTTTVETESTTGVVDETTTAVTDLSTTDDFTSTDLSTTDDGSTEVTTLSVTILKSTDCINSNEIDRISLNHSDNEAVSIEKLHVATTTKYDLLPEEKTDSVKYNISKNSTILPILLGIDKSKNPDYEYDYNEPTLPPSLPNVRIIPFVAADALDSENADHNAIYSKDYVTDSIRYHLFSPPVETEGGFVPKDPPILEGFYPTTSFPKLQMKCIVENREVLHGEEVPSESRCSTCRCYYGNIVCQKIECQIKSECRKVQKEDSCCPVYICNDNTSTTVAPSTGKPYNTSKFNDLSSLDNILSFLFFNNYKSESLTTTMTPSPPTSSEQPIKDDSNYHVTSTSIAILKLAGCNIYGRMYRVGRIISELSNSCLECRCTELGVQCRDLDC